MTQKELHYQARYLLENGVTEDIDLLKAFSSLLEHIGWAEGNEWSAKITQGKAGRNEVRAALKAAKEKDKEQKAAAAAKTENISHAKPKTPPPPPPWTINDAMYDLGEALTYTDAELGATDLLNTWTEEQRKQIEDRLNQATATGAGSDGFKIIKKLVFNGVYSTGYTDIDLLAMIAGYAGKPFDWLEFLAQLQTPREKA